MIFFEKIRMVTFSITANDSVITKKIKVIKLFIKNNIKPCE